MNGINDHNKFYYHYDNILAPASTDHCDHIFDELYGLLALISTLWASNLNSTFVFMSVVMFQHSVNMYEVHSVQVRLGSTCLVNCTC